MKSLSDAFRSHLSGEVTTLCRCWILAPVNGPKAGFTDHDEDITVEGVICERQAGMDTSGIEERIGLSVDSAEVSGALHSDRITDRDIASGYYDNATVSFYVVNWLQPEQNILDQVMLIGEITLTDGIYRMELRGQSSLLDQTRGRHFIKQCQADLGDSRCRYNVQENGYSANGIVEKSLSAARFRVTGLGEFQNGWFSQGHLVWSSGGNSGIRTEVSGHVQSNGVVIVTLWQSMSEEIAVGDAFRITAGCDKTFETCKSRFNNALNFQGFPHMPGDGFAVTYASNADQFDGGPVVP